MISGLPKRTKTIRTYWWGEVFFTILLLLSAWNSGNNILYLAFSVCFSIAVCAEVFSRWNFNPPRLEILVPEQVTRGSEANIWIRLENMKKRTPLFGVSVEAVIEDTRGMKTRVFWKKIPVLPVNQYIEFSLEQKFPKRGRVRITEVVIRSEFPLGIVEREAWYQVDADVLVVPRTQFLKVQSLGNFTGGSRVPTRTLISESGDFYSIREYQPGDDLRYIAWKISARLGVWLVREWALSLPNQYLIYLDLRKPMGENNEEIFEEMMDFVASLAFSLLMKQFRVGIWTEEDKIPLGHGVGHLNFILKRLALLQPIDNEEINEKLWNRFVQEGRSSRLLLLSVNPELWGQVLLTGMRVVNPDVISAGR